MIDLNKYQNTLIAHRGVHDNINIPENSLLAFKKALVNNYSIELDIRLTKDNKLIVSHDDNLKRMTGRNIVIENANYNDIKAIPLLDTKENIPLLKEVLNLVKGKVLLDIEIKYQKEYDKLVEILLDELNSYDGPIIIKSFYPKVLKKIKKKTKKYTLGLLLSSDTKDKKYNLLSKTGLIISYVKPDFIAISKELLNKKHMQKAIKKYPTLVWTIKNSKEIKDINNQKYIYICNNLPYKK